MSQQDKGKSFLISYRSAETGEKLQHVLYNDAGGM